MKSGKFITVEGTEGVGKSTNISFIKSLLVKQGNSVLETREPGGTPLAEELREILLRKREESVDPTAELLMVFAARAQHLNTHILPALDVGTCVLCDRFTDATFAYQGAGRGLSEQAISVLENLVQHGRQPDLTILLDIDVEVGLARAGARAELDRFESEHTQFFQRVRAGYHARVRQRPEGFIVVDAGQALDEVQFELKRKLESWWQDNTT